MSDQLKPLETIEVSIRYWWILSGLMILGGMIGYLFFAMTPPVYESKAVFSLVIDYTKTEKLTDIEADQASVSAGDVFLSKKVVDGVIVEASKQGTPLTQEEFRRMAFLERTNSEWTLIIRSVNAETATKLDNIWAEQSEQTLKEASKHANLSGVYHRQLESLARCVEQVPAVEPSAPVCGFTTLAEMQASINSVSLKESEEANQSMGVLPSLTISLINQADGPGTRIGDGRNIYILAGAFTGLMVFILLNSMVLTRVHVKRLA